VWWTGGVLARVSAYVSLVLGLYGFLAALSGWGAAVGAVMGALALLAGWASVTERPPARTRRVALVGMAAGAAALATVLVWIVLAIFGV
jgi:hypothetical protein